MSSRRLGREVIRNAGVVGGPWIATAFGLAMTEGSVIAAETILGFWPSANAKALQHGSCNVFSDLAFSREAEGHGGRPSRRPWREAIRNAGGIVGPWLSRLLKYLFQQPAKAGHGCPARKSIT